MGAARDNLLSKCNLVRNTKPGDRPGLVFPEWIKGEQCVISISSGIIPLETKVLCA